MAKYYDIDIKGKHWLPRVSDASIFPHVGAEDEGKLIYSESDERIYLASTTEWVKSTSKYDEFSQGTKLLMGNFPLPNGWNIDTSFNDFVPLISQTIGSVFTSAGDTWTITGLQSNETHDHQYWTGEATGTGVYYWGSTGFFNPSVPMSHIHRVTETVDGIHFHFQTDNSWRFANVKYCVAEYQ